MSGPDNIRALIEAGRLTEAISLLCKRNMMPAVTGPRSARAALEAATRLFSGEVDETARWMTAYSVHLGMSPREYAERSDGDLEEVLRFIGQLELGVYP